MKGELNVKKVEFLPVTRSWLQEAFGFMVLAALILGYQLFKRVTEVAADTGHSLSTEQLASALGSTLVFGLIVWLLGYKLRDFYEINLGTNQVMRCTQFGRAEWRRRVCDLSSLVWVATQNRFSPASKYSREHWLHRAVLVTRRGRLLPAGNWETGLESGYRKACNRADEIAGFSGIRRQASEPTGELKVVRTVDGPRLNYVTRRKPSENALVYGFIGSGALLIAVAYGFANDPYLPVATVVSQLPFMVFLLVVYIAGGTRKN